MNKKIHATLAMTVALALLIGFAAGCGSSDDSGLSIEDIPLYPNAAEGESMEQSSPGGMVGGSLAQFTTSDAYDEVLDFYTDALMEYDTELISHESDLGRQAAISIPQKRGMVSVSIQEFTEEETVNITFMSVGS